MRKCFLFFCGILFLLSSFAHEKSAKELLNESEIARNTNYITADSLIKLAISKAQVNGSDSILTAIYYTAGKIQADEGFFDEAESYFFKAIEIVDDSNTWELHAKIKTRLADNYLDQGDLDNAVKTALEAIEISTYKKDSRLLIHSNVTLGEIYRHYDIFDLALKYTRKALAIALVSGTEDDLGRTYNNLSAILGEMEKNEEAIDSLKKGLSLLNDTNWFGKAKLNSNIGFCYRNMEKYTEALEYHRIALHYKKKANMTYNLAYTLGAIGRAHIGLGNADSAIYYVKQERELALKFKNIHQINDATSHLSDAYEAAKDFENAYKYQIIAESIEDSLFKKDTEDRILLFQRKYDLSKKERELAEVKSQQLLENEATKSRNILLIALLISFLLMAIAFRFRAAKKGQEKKVVELQLDSIQKEHERDKLALSDFTKDLVLKNKSIKELTEKLNKKENEIVEIRNAKSEELEQLSDFKILTEEDWTKFKILFEKVYPNFFAKLNASDSKFTKGEKRLMALIKLDMENNEVADALGISSESVSKSRFRLKKKLDNMGFESIEDLVHRL